MQMLPWQVDEKKTYNFIAMFISVSSYFREKSNKMFFFYRLSFTFNKQ